ncbi:SPOR domain-containing protein [Thalassotalea sp. LPB0316]|uniref:SPOR domain-containing protein n=1 Tax=Thalassotalea sp. LPB0316 TaxID=2769490 RepID=UPI001867A9BD|nr:SPOR domain-containing protein [Thalassotalea sp. LPB0316]QOL25994.1 SPOR domain-containing protein [Thalassotalea sp. LPB0316]
MAPQDYVSRKPNNKKKSPYKKDVAQVSAMPLKTKVILAITVFFSAAFGYGLWKLNQTPAQPPITIEPTKSTSSKEEVTLPEPPKEKWDYMKELETKEVEVGEYEVTNKGPYQMQCGSFRTREQAEVLKAKIAFAGITSQVRETTGTNGTWYKVILGPYERKRLAEKDKHLLKNNDVNRCQIWLWR